MKTKIIPFDLEMAKKIQSGEIEGKIMTEYGDIARVICWDRLDKTHPIIALVNNKAKGLEESVYYYTNKGKVFYNLSNLFDLHIEVPDNESHFKPFDKVLVRENDASLWKAGIYSHELDGNHFVSWGCFKQCIPYKGNEHLVDTINKPKEE